jgi:hypothetical protein
MEMSGQLHVLAVLSPTGCKSCWYSLDRRLDGPYSLSRSCEVDKNYLSLSGVEPKPSSSYPVAILGRNWCVIYDREARCSKVCSRTPSDAPRGTY